MSEEKWFEDLDDDEENENEEAYEDGAEDDLLIQETRTNKNEDEFEPVYLNFDEERTDNIDRPSLEAEEVGFWDLTKASFRQYN